MVMNNFGNRNFMQPIGSLCMHSQCLDFFLLSFEWGGEGGFFSFFLCGGRRKVRIFLGSARKINCVTCKVIVHYPH